jgi:hypothetical protein
VWLVIPGGSQADYVRLYEQLADAMETDSVYLRSDGERREMDTISRQTKSGVTTLYIGFVTRATARDFTLHWPRNNPLPLNPDQGDSWDPSI